MGQFDQQLRRLELAVLEVLTATEETIGAKIEDVRGVLRQIRNLRDPAALPEHVQAALIAAAGAVNAAVRRMN